MLQNHLLQLVCLIAMEPPSFYEADQLRDEKLRVLKALKPITEEEIQTGQYRSFSDELGENSNTETFVSLKVLINNWRWAGVCLLYTSPSPRDSCASRMPSSA